MAIPEVGEKLGRYRLLELVGQGGMASVYRAQDEDLDREVAIKILHPHLEGREDARLRFRREAKTVARIEHPNIVGIFDYSGEDASTSFIVTQFIHGPHLRQLLERKGPFPPVLAAAMARQVAEGLKTAHDAGIVHRDVKPENILVSDDGLLKVADFGIAHLTDTQDMTATGQILGSPYYMSPEQVQGKKLDARADVFSFGTLLYLLVTGRQAFEGSNPHSVLRRICDGRIDPPERLAPEAGQAMARIIRSCLVKDREQRPSSLVPIAEQLDEYLAQSGMDDPAREVARFLEDPDGYRRACRVQTIEALLRAAGSMQHRGDSSGAMDAYNRILALDAEHPEALARVQDVASSRSRRRLVSRVAVVLLAALVIVAAVVWGPRLLARHGRADLDGASLQETGAAGDASTAMPSVVKGTPPVEAPPEPVADAGTDPPVKFMAVAKKHPSIRPPKKLPGKARVKFVPWPKSVIIWVDGKKIGGYFHHQDMELSVGEHTVRFEPEDPDCCEPAEWKVKVQPAGSGDKPQVIGRRLSFKPATLFISTDKPATVKIDGKNAGPTGKTIPVAMKGGSTREVTVTVSAEGYETVTKKVELEAGKSKVLSSIKMKPASG